LQRYCKTDRSIISYRGEKTSEHKNGTFKPRCDLFKSHRDFYKSHCGFYKSQ